MAVALSERETCRLTRRLLLLQVLLNYRSMQGEGYLYALWPWLRRSESRAVRVQTAAGFLNAHPVMASLALGALRRRIEDGDTELVSWKDSLCGPLGMVGDALIWDLWKPLIFALGALVLLLAPSPAAWVILAAACVLVYNAPLAWARHWGVREGYRLGAGVLSALNHPLFSALPKYLGRAGAVAAGLLVGISLMAGSRMQLVPAAQFIVGFGLTWFALRRGIPLLYTLPVAMGAALAVSLIHP
jgi:mannose/fructose/N-acetylgalactosamine-specific phosphotransferase system component IID